MYKKYKSLVYTPPGFVGKIFLSKPLVEHKKFGLIFLFWLQITTCKLAATEDFCVL